MIYPADITVCHEDGGAPYVDGVWIDESVRPPEVSLSHDGHVSVAAVSSPMCPVGVDVEHAGKALDPDLLEHALTASERKRLRGVEKNLRQERILRLWCAKESAAKYLGLGLKGRPEEFEVSFSTDDWNRAAVNYRGNTVEVSIRAEKEMIIALAICPHSTGDTIQVNC
jgi:phosphopantetheine--protein transferase-like protein